MATESDRDEFRYAAASVMVIPVESRIESIRSKQDTNTGIFYNAARRGSARRDSKKTHETHNNGEPVDLLHLFALLQADELF